MADHQPPTLSPQANNNDNLVLSPPPLPDIPIDIVSDEEMALIEAAFAAAAATARPSPSSFLSSLSPARLKGNGRSIQSITVLSKRSLSTDSSPSGDIEDMGCGLTGTQKRIRLTESFFHRFRKKRGLSVTDLTASEWCEKQMEYILLLGKPKSTKAMKAGSQRHAVLEEEVIQRVKVQVRTVEDVWALKFMNFMTGVNQLLFDGLTRELPLVGFVEGVWMVGIIDELQMPPIGSGTNPKLVDTKTRVRNTLPSAPQQRNGRLQLMCYKYMWDNLAADNFPSARFFNFFSLNPYRILSEDIREKNAHSEYPVETLDDLLRYFRNTCRVLPSAHEQLLLRYELQEDQSLIGEDHFAYDSDWVKGQIRSGLEFWLGEREAKYTPEEERWKCNFCKFASDCSVNNSTNSEESKLSQSESSKVV